MKVLTTHHKMDHPLWTSRTVLLPGWRDYVERTWKRRPRLRDDFRWAWRLFRYSRRFDVVVTGSERPSLIFAVLQRIARRRRTPHVLIECLWRLPTRGLASFLKRAWLRLIVGSVQGIAVHARRQIDIYAAELALPSHSREKFIFIPCHTTLYGKTYNSVRGGYVFSGGDSKRDYVTLVEAARNLSCPVKIVTSSAAQFGGVSIPDNVEIVTGGISFDDFYRLAAGAAVVVIPVQPGKAFPGGQQVYENAMALGKPVIVADDCGAEDYIDNGVNGIIVPPADPVALANAIRTVMSDDNLADTLGRESRLRAAQFTPEFFLERVFSLCERNCRY